jgi:hypothetical protein
VPPVKKQSRPRIDAIVRHIRSGSYDDEIEQIKAAIDERNKARQDSVMKTVRSVFGEKAMVVLDEPRVNTGPTPEDASASRPGPSRRPRPGGPPPSQATPDALSDDPAIREAEAAALARERELEAEMIAQTANGVDPSDEEAGIESNSPVIGSMG